MPGPPPTASRGRAIVRTYLGASWALEGRADPPEGGRPARSSRNAATLWLLTEPPRRRCDRRAGGDRFARCIRSSRRVLRLAPSHASSSAGRCAVPARSGMRLVDPTDPLPGRSSPLRCAVRRCFRRGKVPSRASTMSCSPRVGLRARLGSRTAADVVQLGQAGSPRTSTRAIARAIRGSSDVDRVTSRPSASSHWQASALGLPRAFPPGGTLRHRLGPERELPLARGELAVVGARTERCTRSCERGNGSLTSALRRGAERPSPSVSGAGGEPSASSRAPTFGFASPGVRAIAWGLAARFRAASCAMVWTAPFDRVSSAFRRAVRVPRGAMRSNRKWAGFRAFLR